MHVFSFLILFFVSIGMFGVMYQLHCTPLFHFQPMSAQLTRSFDRLMIRPTERHDDSFWIMVGGKVDFAKLLSSQDEFVKFVHATSNRSDFNIKEIIQITEYKYVYFKDIQCSERGTADNLFYA